MNPRKALLALAAIPALALGACGQDEAPTPSPSSTASSTSTSAKPTESEKPSPTSSTPSPEAAPAVEEPYVVECIFGTPGPSRMSDGTVQNTEYCGNQPGAQAYRDAESAAGLDPSEIPYAEGGTCPAYQCGYGHDENGNPNPSSGELQTLHGCDEGYITDQNLCGAVQNKADQYGW